MKKPEDGTIRWIKKGRGSLRFNGKIVKPNQVFSAREDEIPTTFRDSIIPVDPRQITQKEDTPPVPPEKLKSVYEAIHVSGGWYNVVDENGKVMNENKLRAQTAQTFIDSLT